MMTVCAVMLVRDEADIIGYTAGYLLTQVDHLIVADNMSSDGTWDILAALGAELHRELAQMAFKSGYDWVLPCDADEIWHTKDGRPIRDYLRTVSPGVDIVTADLFNHIPTALDPDLPDPIRRMGWRKRDRGTGKVACRLRADLVIQEGNHGAAIDGIVVESRGLVIRHFPWRSDEQYIRKIRHGAEAVALTDLPEDVGGHWRKWARKSDEEIVNDFRRLHWSGDPRADRSLIYDPAPPHGDLRSARRQARILLSAARGRAGALRRSWR